jgi:hypothetical protein
MNAISDDACSMRLARRRFYSVPPLAMASRHRSSKWQRARRSTFFIPSPSDGAEAPVRCMSNRISSTSAATASTAAMHALKQRQAQHSVLTEHLSNSGFKNIRAATIYPDSKHVFGDGHGRRSTRKHPIAGRRDESNAQLARRAPLHAHPVFNGELSARDGADTR